MKYNLISVNRKKNAIVHEVDEGRSAPARYKYATIRCGLAWPGASHPGYYIILGEGWADRINQTDGLRMAMRVFMEKQHEGLSLDGLFDRMTDDMMTFGCTEIYADIREKNKSFKEGFWQYQEANQGRTIALKQAPWAHDWLKGIQNIFKVIDETNRLRLPEGSIALEQLRRVDKRSAEKEPHKTFWAIEALRHVVGSLEKYPPKTHFDNFDHRENFGPNFENAWMAN